MKYLDLKSLNDLPGKHLKEGESFRFKCRPELACFTRCCRNLNLYLSPYDVLRLKSALGMNSDIFIDTYIDVVLRPGNHFPEVLLRMSAQDGSPCPFLEPAGCRVYADRPDTCRMFPVEQGAICHAGSQKIELIHFFRPPDFCLGKLENDEWTPAQWIKNQEAIESNRMTLRWAELKRMFQTDPWGAQGPAGPKGKMAFMAAYNLDRFREFVFQSTFLKRYHIKTNRRRRIKQDDTALLLFGFDWIRHVVWGHNLKAS